MTKKLGLISLVAAAALSMSACDALDKATADRPGGTQRSAIGDIFKSGASIGALADPATASDSDFSNAFNMTPFAFAVNPSLAPAGSAQAALSQNISNLASSCEYTESSDNGVDRVDFTNCIIGDCKYDGFLTDDGAGNFAGELSCGPAEGSTSTLCPPATQSFGLTLIEDDAAGRCDFTIDEEGTVFGGFVSFDAIKVGDCGGPAEGSMTVAIEALDGAGPTLGGVDFPAAQETFNFESDCTITK